jgi:hypothetical protein
VYTFSPGRGGVNGRIVNGDYWGTGHRAIGVYTSRAEGPTGLSHYWLLFHRTDSNRIADSPSVVWDSWLPGQPDVKLSPQDVLSADLNNDGADELIIIAEVVLRNGERRTNPEIWIYKGGADFQVTSPVAVIIDSVATEDGGITATAGYLNDDRYADFIYGGDYRFSTPSNRLTFFRGLSDSPFVSIEPDRIITVPSGTTTPNARPTTVDADGDGRLDLIGVGHGDSMGVYLWLSSSGKDPFTRPYNGADADRYIRMAGNAWPPGVGCLNDRTKHYQMTAIGDGLQMYAFSGGPSGPNTSYDAWYNPESDGLFGEHVFGGAGGPLSDVNGDGWDDVITGSSSYAVFGPNQGIAIILAGGPYIPNDDPTVSVQEVATSERSDALHLWPNPVRDILHIAWRGDLKRMPARMAVHDISGRVITEGAVQPGRGEALWRCASVAAGTYVLTIYDSRGEVIATEKIVKE